MASLPSYRQQTRTDFHDSLAGQRYGPFRLMVDRAGRFQHSTPPAADRFDLTEIPFRQERPPLGALGNWEGCRSAVDERNGH